MKYLFDNDISPHFAKMLHALHVDIVALRELMPANTKDCDFLADLQAKHGIDVFISNNSTQRTNPIERELLKASGVISLYLTPFWSNLTFWPQAKWLVYRWEQIDGFSKGVASGTCADLQQNGRSRIDHL